MTTEIRPAGYIGLTSIHGEVGKLIKFGQWLNGDGFSEFEHAFISLGNGKILEAEPGGSRIRDVSEYQRNVWWCDGIGRQLTGQMIETAGDRRFYSQFVGIPYSFVDYDALIAHRLHLPIPGLRYYIQNSGHEICSQLVDDFNLKLGNHIFKDDRWMGYVTPGMLFNRDLELRHAQAV